jgi:hypothetical protein
MFVGSSSRINGFVPRTEIPVHPIVSGIRCSGTDLADRAGQTGDDPKFEFASDEQKR